MPPIVLRGLPSSPDPRLQGGAVTWGVFDGVHRGHRKVLESLTDFARELRGPSIVVTFDRHPAEILRGLQIPLVVPLEARIDMIGGCGVTAVIVIPFTLEFSKTTADRFVRDVIYDRLRAKAVLLGHDSHFGKDRTGDFETLARVAGELGIQVRKCESEKAGGRPMSSTLIRELVRDGKLAEAREVLGRPFAVYGTVVKGEGRGSTIGIPTANLRVENSLRPPSGVYRVEVTLDGKSFVGAANIGSRPTFHPGGAPETVEVHLLDYAGGPLLGRSLEVRFLDRVRDEKKFSGPAELVTQIRRDLDWIRLQTK